MGRRRTATQLCHHLLPPGSIDTSGNGVIELSEWVDFFELIELARVDARASTARKGLVERAKAEVGAARAAKLRAAFEAYDTDGDGAVAAYELANVMRQMGAAVSDAAAGSPRALGARRVAREATIAKRQGSSGERTCSSNRSIRIPSSSFVAKRRDPDDNARHAACCPPLASDR